MKAMIAAIQRRIGNMVADAVIRRAADGGAIQALQLDLLADETRTGIDRVQEYGFTSVPLDGARAVALFLGGERDHGVVIATDDGRYRIKGLAGGDVAVYDNRGQFVKLTAAGVDVESATAVKVKAPAITLDGAVTVTGDLTVQGLAAVAGNLTVLTGATPISMSTFRDTYNGHTHNENDNAPNPTGAPNQTI